MTERLEQGKTYKIFKGGARRDVLYIGVSLNPGVKHRHLVLTRYETHKKGGGDENSVYAYRFGNHDLKDGEIKKAWLIHQGLSSLMEENKIAEKMLQRAGL